MPGSTSFSWSPVLWALLGAIALELALWVVAWRRQNANWVDVGWSLCLFGMAVLYAFIGDGSVSQRALIGLVAGVWSGRLTLHLLYDRAVGKPEDGRYRYLRDHWGERADANFVGFFVAQAVLAAGLSLVFWVVAQNPMEGVAPVQWAGVALFVLAKSGETVADRQLKRFRDDPGNKGRTCREGLWRYSRHPNYFFEWLIWIAFALIATPAPYGAYTWFAPLLMLVLITKVTGIPYTELQSIRSRGDDYRRYQETTSAFIPWFPSSN